MFNKDFYPTPEHVIEYMYREIRGYDKKISILDPSAGSGSLLLYLKNKGFTNVKAIEIQPELQGVLSQKGFRVIGEDFLEYNGPYQFDIIFMNPPFSNGYAHVTKAFEILKPGGQLISLYNADSFEENQNRYQTALRNLVSRYGKFVNLGPTFMDAERKTKTNIGLIVMQKEAQQTFEFNTKSEQYDYTYEEFSSGIKPFDKMEALVNRYKANQIAYVNLVRAYKEFQSTAFSTHHATNAKNLIDSFSNPNEYLDYINQLAWENVLNSSKFLSFLTEKVKKDFMDKFNTQKSVEFTKQSISDLYDVLFYNRNAILKQCVIDVFDTFTKYTKENRFQPEGWATNDAYMINRKVIIPYMVEYGQHSTANDLKAYGDYFYVSYRQMDQLNDFDRACCVLTNKKMTEVKTIEAALRHHFKELGRVKTGQDFANEVDSEFFHIKFFKKGTIHLTFKDERLWSDFNRVVAEHFGFPLPGAR